MDRKKIVVCGATGKQGGAVIRHLLRDARWEVIGLTRDPHSEAAVRLRHLGAEMVTADNSGQASLVHAFRGAYGVFGVTQPWDEDAGHYNIQKEITQGKNIIWACSLADIRHLVFSSIVNPLNEITGVSFIDSKLVLESLLAQQGVPYTIMRTGLYMENIDIPVKGRSFIRGNYNGETPLPYIALRDLGKFASDVFAETAKYIDKSVDVIGDLCSGHDIAGVMTDLSGVDYEYRGAPVLPLRLLKPDLYKLRRYFEKFVQPQYHQALRIAVSNFKWTQHEVCSVAKFLERRQAKGLMQK